VGIPFKINVKEVERTVIMLVLFKHADINVLSEDRRDDAELLRSFHNTFYCFVKGSFWNSSEFSPLGEGGCYGSEELGQSFFAVDESICFIIECVIHSEVNVLDKHGVISVKFGVLPIQKVLVRPSFVD